MRDQGAVPATVAVLDGVPRVGLTAAELDRVCGGGLVKLSVRDLGVAVGLRRDGATTVAATAALAAAAGIALFATGGLGGVHRGARETWDVSADLGALARTPVLTVCSGVKSILDVPATLELLETVVGAGAGLRHRRLPRLLPPRLRAPGALAGGRPGAGGRGVAGAPGRWAAARAWCWPSPCRPRTSWTRRCTTGCWPRGSRWWRSAGSSARTSRPPCWRTSTTASGGASLAANLALVRANAELAAQVAVALAG